LNRPLVGLEKSEIFDLLASVRLNIVCFAPRNHAVSAQLIAAVRDSDATFFAPTVLHGTAAIRTAFGSWRTTASDLEIIWEALVAARETACA
jgi:hypothetical protein